MLDAAIDAGTSRILYVSTVNVFGNTKEQVVDESYQRDESEGFLSCYDETKYRSHQIAKDRIAKGAPIVIVQPGGVYGPGDHSELGNFIDQTRTGKLRAKAFPRARLQPGLRGRRRRRASCWRSTRARSASRTSWAGRSRAWTT